jgi:hypothetical protein
MAMAEIELPPGVRARPRRASPPVTLGRATMLMGLGASLAGALLFAMAPDVLWLFAARALMGVGVGLAARPFAARTAMTVGAFASAAGMGLLALAVALHGLPAFLLATATAGAGYSLLFLNALQVVNAAAPAQQRGGMLSAPYLLAYLSMGMVAIILGIVATGWRLRLAVVLGAGVIAILSLATLALASTMRAPAYPPFRLAPGCACSNP